MQIHTARTWIRGRFPVIGARVQVSADGNKSVTEITHESYQTFAIHAVNWSKRDLYLEMVKVYLALHHVASCMTFGSS
jgi:hypothetical protein